jgi:hypothetical protein
MEAIEKNGNQSAFKGSEGNLYSQTSSLHSTTGYDTNDPFQGTVGHTRMVPEPVPYLGEEVYC